MFELLISVSGVGAKSALVMLSCIEPSDFAIAVISNDVKVLTKVPGIGNKSAQRIILELKDKLKGSYAFNIINSDIPNKIYGIRKDVPLIVGVSDHGNMFASDIPAILHVTNKYIVLNNNEIVELEQDNIKYYNSEGKEITKEVKEYAGTIDSISKNGYDHFMLKEINEESEVVKNILNLYTKNNKIANIAHILASPNINDKSNISE